MRRLRVRMRTRAFGALVIAPALALVSATVPVEAGQPFATAAVACDHPLASQAGVEVLRRGGNAVDAAVAASFTLSVVRPYSCGIGGGGFMLIHRPATAQQPALDVALNYRETAPAGLGPDTYEGLAAAGDEDASRYGPAAIGVPGTVAGLLHALEHHGRLPLNVVLAPAIRVAESGFAADANFVAAIATLGQRRSEVDGAGGWSLDLWTGLGAQGALQVGDIIRNPRQAAALRLIAESGRAGFYEGPVADAIVEATRGRVSHDDLRGYAPRVGSPLRGTFLGRTVLTMPPPSSGGIAMLQVLGIVERLGAGRAPAADDPAYAHALIEAMKHAFADRARWLADDAFVDVPRDRLLDGMYLDDLVERIEPNATQTDPTSYGSVAPPPDDAGTSHLSVLDADGMAVACTETINLTFGSLVVAEPFGFALNDEMDDFTTIRGQANAFGLQQSDRNLPEAGKRPLSSMSPTIVLDGDRAVIVAGASGGPRIITGTLQVILNAMLFDAGAEEAVTAPRLHHQWMPDTLRIEPAWGTQASRGELERRGHALEVTDEIGVVQIIRVTADGVDAASDPRKGGRPAGY